MNRILPWILAVAFAVTSFMLFSSNQKKDAELSRIPALQQQIVKTEAELDQAKKTYVDQNELERLRKESQEVYKLRGEIAMLKKKLAAQPQAVAQTGYQEQPPAPTDVQPESPPEDPLTKQQREQCIQNLKVIEEAKTMWAVANNKQAGEKATVADITTALPNNAMPLCPAGGVYNLEVVGIPASCNIPGHSLLP